MAQLKSIVGKRNNSFLFIETIDTIIHDFLNSHLGVKKTADGRVQYACELKGNTNPEFQDGEIVKQNWPSQVACFLESIINFVIVKQLCFSPDIIESNDVVGLPSRIISCSDTGEDLLYLCEWDNKFHANMKFVRTVIKWVAKAEFANLVVQYLEPKLNYFSVVLTN